MPCPTGRPEPAKDIIRTGRALGAVEEHRIGLVDEVVPAEQVLDGHVHDKRPRKGQVRRPVNLPGPARRSMSGRIGDNDAAGMARNRFHRQKRLPDPINVRPN